MSLSATVGMAQIGGDLKTIRQRLERVYQALHMPGVEVGVCNIKPVASHHTVAALMQGL